MLKRKKKSEIEKIEDGIKKEWRILNKIKIKDENHLLFASFIVVVTSLLVINTIYVVDKSGTVSRIVHSVTDTTPTNVLTSRETAQTSAYAVTISNVTAQDQPDPAFPLGDNETTLMLNIDVTNRGQGEQDFYPAKYLYVRDRDGGYYTLNPSSLVKNPLQSGVLKPGETISGEISFHVPKRLANPLLYIDLGWGNYVPVVFDVMR